VGLIRPITWSMHVLRLFTLSPRIVGRNKVYAFGARGMVEHPDLIPRARIRIGQVDLAAFFEIVGRYLAGVGDDFVDHLQAIAVGLMLEMTADRVNAGVAKNASTLSSSINIGSEAQSCRLRMPHLCPQRAAAQFASRYPT